MADSTDMIMPMLTNMRAEAKSADANAVRRHEILVARLDKLEETQLSFRQALTGDSLLSKLVTGEFEMRIEELERKVRELETHR